MPSFRCMFVPCLLLVFSAPVRAAESLQVGSLTCEHRSNPLGIEAVKPRLSWKLQSRAKGVQQAAYQITAWNDKAPLWDTGKVMAAESVLVAYAGKPLRSTQQVQ